MDLLGQAFSSAVSAFYPFGPAADGGQQFTESHEIDGRHESPEVCASGTPPDSLDEDWMVVLDEQAELRTVIVESLHDQSGRPGPVSAPLADVDRSDNFIEHPLVASPPRPFGSMSYAAVASIALPENYAPSTSVDSPMGSWEDEDFVDSDEEERERQEEETSGPTYVRIGRNHDMTGFPTASFRGDTVEWSAICKGDRVTRRSMSRMNRK